MKNKTYHLFFSKLSSPLKIEIISLLKKNEKGLSVGELMSTLWVEQSKLSHALAKLRQCNLVIVKQTGKKRVYFLNQKTMKPILEIIDEHSKNNPPLDRGGVRQRPVVLDVFPEKTDPLPVQPSVLEQVRLEINLR